MSQQDFFIQKVQEAPGNKLFRFSLSKILFDQEQFADAIPHLEKCIQLQDDWMLAHISVSYTHLTLPTSRSV